MSGQNPYEMLRRLLGKAGIGRTVQKRGHIARQPASYDTEFRVVEQTVWDPQGQHSLTDQVCDGHILACGCVATATTQVRGICPECAHTWRVWLSRKPRLICRNHSMCLRCRRKRLRRQRLLAAGRWTSKKFMWLTDDE